VTTWATLRSEGRPRRWVGAAVRAGALVRIRRGVYIRPGVCEPVLTATGHGGTLACVAAARHLGLWVLDESAEVHVWLGGGGHAYDHEPGVCGCVEHWDDLPLPDAFGRPSIPHILRQILRCRGVEHFVVSLESALHQGHVGRPEIAWLRAHTNDAAREAIDLCSGLAESGLETLVRWRLRHRGIRIRAQVTIVSVGRVDLLLGDRLIVEVDGRMNHEGEPARHKDLIRDAHAAAWGYITLRFDYAMVVHDWETVELAIFSYIDAGRHLS